MSRGPTLKLLDLPALRAWVWIPDADVRPRWRAWRWHEQNGERTCYRLRCPWLEIHVGTGRYSAPPMIVPPSLEELRRYAAETGKIVPPRKLVEVVWFPRHGWRVKFGDRPAFFIPPKKRRK